MGNGRTSWNVNDTARAANARQRQAPPGSARLGMSDFSLKSEPAHRAHQNIKALDSLQRDMVDALEHDQVRQQVNDAKLRAVAQHVEYDDFAKLVAGAHLKPVKPRSQQLADVCKPFDGFVMPRYEPQQAAAAGPHMPAVAAAPAAVPAAPKTSNEFLRTWRRQLKTAAERCAYLRQLVPEQLPALFRTELDPALFDGIVAAVGEVVVLGGADGASQATAATTAGSDSRDGGGAADPSHAPPANGARSSLSAARREECEWVGRLLSGISRVNRFELTLEFAEGASTRTIAALLDAVEAAAPFEAPLDAAALEALRAVYKV